MTMRVERIGGGRAVAGTKRAGAATGGDRFSIAIDRASGASRADTAAPVTGVGQLAAVDAMVALQSADGDRRQRHAALSRGETILAHLDELRLALLSGDLTMSQIERLVATIANQRAASGDSRLDSVLDEIDLRARVELAKYQMRG